MTERRQLHLNAFLMSTGHHEASWRLPESDPFANTDVAHYQGLARIAERGKFDSLFFADCPVLWGDIGRRPAGTLEPTVLLTALAAATEHIGLIATASTTYNEPFNLARRFASLDHISGGRAGLEHRHHRRAGGGPQLQPRRPSPPTPSGTSGPPSSSTWRCKLWDSWEDDAAVADKEAGVWGDDDRVRADRPRRASTSSVARPAERAALARRATRCSCRPGSSEDGKEFAARYAEAVFTAQQTLEDAQAFYARPQARGPRRHGRDPGRRQDPARHRAGHRRAPRRRRARLERELDELIVPEYARAAAGEDAARRPGGPAARRAAAGTTCPTRTRSRAPRAATR